MFTGLCAFPLTPMRNNEVDSRALIKSSNVWSRRELIRWAFWAQPAATPI